MGAAVAATSNRPDFVPSSMDELARHYYDYILGMVRKAGIAEQEAADSVQYILERLAVTDAVGQFNPERPSSYQGRQVCTRFSTFLGAKVTLYCRGELSRQRKRDGRELLIMDAPCEEGTPAAEVLVSEGGWDDYPVLEEQDGLAGMRDRLSSVPRRSNQSCDLVSLFDVLAAEVEETGSFTISSIQENLGVSGTTAGKWLSRLRKELSSQIEPPVPASEPEPPVSSPETEPPAPSSELDCPVADIGGVPLTAEQVASALEILRKEPGGLVFPPLSKTGHPLAMASADWYHPFAREELRKFPGLAARTGTRRMGKRSRKPGCVKAAVIHRLERILAESSAADPVEEALWT